MTAVLHIVFSELLSHQRLSDQCIGLWKFEACNYLFTQCTACPTTFWRLQQQEIKL